jgi:hypothetical protein
MATDPNWDAIKAIHALMPFVPDQPDGTSRILRCIAKLRDVYERDQYPANPPVPPANEKASEDFCNPLIYPALEVNEAIQRAKPSLQRLTTAIRLERMVKDRLMHELDKPGPFLEADDRGTIGEVIHRAEHGESPWQGKEKARNNSRMDALAQLLEAIRQDPAILLGEIEEILEKARPSMAGWKFDVRQGRIEKAGKVYEELSPEAVLLVKMAVEAAGQWVTVSDLEKRAQEEGIDISSAKIRDIRRSVPKDISQLLQSERGKGTRIEVR